MLQPKDTDWLNRYKDRTYICCLQETHFRPRDTYRLKWGAGKRYSIGEGNGNPLQCSCLENPRDGGAWWAAIYGVAQGRTRLKWLSSSSSRFRSSLNFGWNSAVKPSGPGLLFAGWFLITVSISMFVICVLWFSNSSWSSFGKLYFSKNFSISFKLSILLAYNCW